MLMTADDWRDITRAPGESPQPDTDVEAAIADAVALIEDRLGRPLESAERTETVWADRAGWLWPTATPITDAPSDVVGAGLPGYPVCEPVNVTYTGGWTADTLPASIRRDIAWTAWVLLGYADRQLTDLNLTRGISSVRVGDISIQTTPEFATGSGGVDPDWIRLSAATMRWRRRKVISA